LTIALRELVVDLISDGLGATVSPTIRETVYAVADLSGDQDDEVKVIDVAKQLNIDKSSASRRCRAAIDVGYIVNHEDRKGKPYRMVIGDPMPDDIEVLPTSEVLHGCTNSDGEEALPF